jgi:phosphatidate phosphatase APP1
MPDWRRDLSQLASGLRSELEVHLRAARDLVAARLESDAPYSIDAYRGYGTRERVVVRGRALRAPGLSPADAADPAWRNLLNMYRRIESDPIPRASVRVSIGGVERTLVADEEGFFSTWISPAAPLPDAPWVDAAIELLSPTLPDMAPVRATAKVRLLGGTARFGVISDVDDTVLQSSVTNLVQALRTTLLGNARTRLPFPGVAAFYRALEHGPHAASAENPVFYVSSSPWNLHDLIAEFMEVQKLPTGPLLLRDWDLNIDALGHGRLHSHKTTAIKEILALNPTLPFILIGDSGQQDPEIYRAIVHEHPGRVLAVYIRDVTRLAPRTAAITKLAEEIVAAHSSLILSEDTLGAAKHAAEHGWIDAGRLGEIGADAAKDEGTAPGKVEV